jgi:CDP-diacylglycerol--glycerol-3-phosphate 3-phosphatidyltransferase
VSDPESRILTLPNALTCARLLAVPVVLALLVAGSEAWAAALFVAAALTDFLDGRLARRRGGASRLGALLDPLADRLMISGVAVVLAVKGLLPAILVALLVGRDALALVGGILLRGKVRVNKVGKAATALLMVAAAVEIFRPGVPGEILFYFGIGLSIVSGLLYARSARNSIR